MVLVFIFSGKFMGLEACNLEGTYGKIRWSTGNWTTFIDSMLHLVILQEDTRFLYVPTTMGRVVIDARKHLMAAVNNDMMSVYCNNEIRAVR